MKIGIVGAGLTGLVAAYDLLPAGHEVTLFEGSHFTGGLAAGFRDERWEWPVEKFYHHLFTSDKAIIGLAGELGIRDKLFFPRPVTSVIYNGQIVPFDSPLAWVKFPGFSWLDVVRFGLVSAYLRFSNPWPTLEKSTADTWLRQWYGPKIYETTWRPMLIGKFGPHYQTANMAWMWARLKVRSPRLGYFEGGFQFFIDQLTHAVEKRGGEILFNAPVNHIGGNGSGRIILQTPHGQSDLDACLVTTSPSVMARMTPELPDSYLGQLNRLKSMGAVVLTLALKQPLMKETYWLNVPAGSPNKSQNPIPFLALVEHTNYISPKHYGGDHLVYCGDYVTPDHPYLQMSQPEIEQLFTASLTQINPAFKPDWVRKSWLFKATYAQPIPELNHSQHIPPIPTPLPNLYFASMSQVYPWDRGTNYAVALGRNAAQIMQKQF